MPSQYGELRPTSGWNLLASLGHLSKFQPVLRLGSVTARHSSSGNQPKIAALNRGHQLHSAGRPTRWALVHILVFSFCAADYAGYPRAFGCTKINLIVSYHIIRHILWAIERRQLILTKIMDFNAVFTIRFGNKRYM